MLSRSLCQRLAPFALASLLFACGSDGASDNTDDPVVKKDAGIKKKDGGRKTDEEEEQADEEREDDDVGSSSADAGVRKGGKVEITGDSEDIACEKNDDCPSDEMSGSAGCCDQPTKVCFLADSDKCPAAPGRGVFQPAYN